MIHACIRRDLRSGSGIPDPGSVGFRVPRFPVPAVRVPGSVCGVASSPVAHLAKQNLRFHPPCDVVSDLALCNDMAIQSFRDLQAWQLGMAFVVDIYTMSRRLPAEERYGLTAQFDARRFRSRQTSAKVINSAANHTSGVSRWRWGVLQKRPRKPKSHCASTTSTMRHSPR